MFVSNLGNGTILEYTTTGTLVSVTPLVSGLSVPVGLALSGSDLFVSNQSGTVGEYTTAGATLNSTLIVSANFLPLGITVSGSNLFVGYSNSSAGRYYVGEYTTPGAPLSTRLIAGVNEPEGLAVFGTDLFVSNYGSGTIGEYTTAGEVVNPALVSGLTSPEGIAVAVPLLSLTTPATAASINAGSSYSIDWTGGNPTDTVQIWAEGGPNNAWVELTTGVPASNGSYAWNTTGAMHGWYYFQAWDIPTSGPPMPRKVPTGCMWSLRRPTHQISH